MSNLLVRNLDEDIVNQVKHLAIEAGMSTEAYHREILSQWVASRAKPTPLTLTQVLLNMPKIDCDDDIFARVQSDSTTRDVDFSQ